MLELDITYTQLNHLKKAVESAWGRVSIYQHNVAQPLLDFNLIIQIEKDSSTYEITDRGIAFLGLDVQDTKKSQQVKRFHLIAQQMSDYEPEPEPRRKPSRTLTLNMLRHYDLLKKMFDNPYEGVVPTRNEPDYLLEVFMFSWLSVEGFIAVTVTGDGFQLTYDGRLFIAGLSSIMAE